MLITAYMSEIVQKAEEKMWEMLRTTLSRNIEQTLASASGRNGSVSGWSLSESAEVVDKG